MNILLITVEIKDLTSSTLNSLFDVASVSCDCEVM